MKKLYLVVVCLLIAGLLLGGFGCAKEAPPAPAPTPAPAPAPTPAPAPPAWSPTKPITLICHYGPGGGYDVYGRGIAAHMKKYLGVEVVVKNVPGAGGNRGTTFLWKAKPDGYTIGILDIAGLTTQRMILETEYDLPKFTWLGQCAAEAYVMAVAGNSPFYSVEDLQKAAAEKPIRLVVTGVPASELIMTLIAFRTMGIPFTHVPGYGSSVEGAVGVIRGDAEVVTYPPSSLLALIESGDLRPLWVFRSERMEMLPDTPTVVELGYPELTDLRGELRVIAAPPNMPKEIADVLEEALMKTLRDPGFLAWSEKAKRPINAATGVEAKASVTGMYDIFFKNVEALKEYVEQTIS